MMLTKKTLKRAASKSKQARTIPDAKQFGREHFVKWLNTASEVLAKPPVRPYTERPTPKGDLVARFVLPLEYCQTTNRTRRDAGWAQHSLKEKIRRLLEFQEVCFRNRPRRTAPLPGRPQIFAIRFSCREADAYSDFGKAPIDFLGLDSRRTNSKTGQVTYIRRLNYIHDDAPKWAEIHQWQEYVPNGEGFVLIAIYTGETHGVPSH